MFVTRVLQEILFVTLSVLVILLYPLAAVILSLVAFYRFIIEMVVKGNDPEILSIITGMDAAFCGEDPLTKPVSQIFPFFTIDEKPDIKQFEQMLGEKLIKPRDNNGKCVFPEMTQCIVRKYGYYFWRKNKDFSLGNHIRYVNEEDPETPMTREELNDYIFNKLVKIPFRTNQSPWEAQIVPNYKDSENSSAKSAILFRFNHCILDGYSGLNFMNKSAVKPWIYKGAGSKSSTQKSLMQTVAEFLFLLFIGPYHLVKSVFCADDNNDWTKASSKGYKNQIVFAESKVFDLDTLRIIKNHFKVNTTSVFLSLAAESLRRVSESRHMSASPAHIVIPAPLPNHPDNLTNYWTPARFPIVYGKTNSVQTLQNINAEFEKLKTSVLPIVTWNLTKALGLFPIFLQPKTENMGKSTLVMSNVVGPPHPIDMFGYQMIEFGCGGTPLPQFALLVGIMGFKERIRFGVAADQCVLPEKKDAVAFVSSMEDILEEWLHEAENSKQQE